MILSVALLPQFHGQIGLLDELELCLAPIVVVITLLVYRFLNRRKEMNHSAGSQRGRSVMRFAVIRYNRPQIIAGKF
jgi:hypothetical protein